MVREQDCGSDSECERQSNKNYGRTTNKTCNDEIHAKRAKTTGKFSIIREKTQALLKKYYPSPLKAITMISEFRKEDILLDPKNQQAVFKAIDDFGMDLIDKTIRDYYEMLKDIHPVFYKSMNYGSLDDSVAIVDRLIRFQCDDDDEKIQTFLNDLSCTYAGLYPANNIRS